jgi:two-component system alkaline phosphatase synthesis response regulator PhoP
MVTILVADDQPGIRTLLATILRSRGAEVVTAADGDAAWEIIRRLRPAVAVLDVMMPGRDGLDLTRAMRGDPDLASARIVIVSANGSDADIREGLAAGADHYLVKPFSPRALLAAVEGALGEPTGGGSRG